MTIPLRFISFLRLGFQISPWSPHRITPKNVSNVTRIQAIPSRQDFRGANGGEFRKSFHGYPPGFAQVVASPTQFQITPMQMLGRSGKQKLLRDVIRMSSDYKCYTFGVCFGGVGWWIWWVISWCDDVRENVGRCLCGILFMLWNLGTPFLFNLSHLAILQGLTPGIVRRWISLILHVLCLVQCPGHSLHLLGVKSITC